jgi:hypothetical protein
MVVGRFENPEVPVLYDGHWAYSAPPPLVEIGLTAVPKSGSTVAPVTPGTTPLILLEVINSEVLAKDIRTVSKQIGAF